MPQQYPLSAIVGSDDLLLALILAAVAPDVGGVLVRGEKGTAKTTAVRGLAAVLPPIEVIAGDRFSSDPRDPAPLSPDGPFAADAPVECRPVRLVELPVGATEDRVLGSLHLQRALSEGVAEYEPGLLARAHRGILYVDEVNLLHDHLVDVLLDAAATGRVTIERDGVSVEHAARFVLVGTMNPEEGELRPQLLDRFGLAVQLSASRDPRLRAEVIRRRLAFDRSPDDFAARFAADEDLLRDRIAAARARLGDVELDATTLLRIAEICSAFEVDGMRADIVMARTAAAHAAWEGRSRIGSGDLRVAARLALPHRRRRNPFDAPDLDEERLDDLLEQTEPEPDPDPDPGPPSGAPDPGEQGAGEQSSGDQGSAAPSPTAPDDLDPDAGPRTGQRHVTAPAGDPYRARLLTVSGVGRGEPGRRSRAQTQSGRRIGAHRHGAGGGLHLLETVRAAAPHQRARGRTRGRLRFAADDLRVAVKEGRESNLVLFCVDASGSMAAHRRMAAVKTAIVSLLTDAYQRRDKVGLVTFRGGTAELALPPTGSVEVAVARLRELPAGGRTPLAEALTRVAEVVRVEAVRDPRRRPLLVLVTDGRATHGPDPLLRAHRAAAELGRTGLSSVVIDCETGRFRMGLAARLAELLNGELVRVADVDESALTSAARQVSGGAA